VARLTVLPQVIALLFGGSASAQAGAHQATASPDPAAAVQLAAEEARNESAQDVLVALIGGGIRWRQIDLDVGDLAGGTENRSLGTGAYFDLGWHLLIRPMGHQSPRPSVRAIVLQADGGVGFGIRVQPQNTGISLRTDVWRLVGQLGYLYPLRRVLVGGLTGVGADIFDIDLNSVLPSSRIVYARVGPAVEYALVYDTLAIRLDVGARFPFHLGEIESAFGTDASGFGLDTTLALRGRIEAGFTYAFRVVWRWYRLRFAGAFDDVPAAGNGGRGTDHAVGLQFLVGWSL
jgi:hypothetical protein